VESQIKIGRREKIGAWNVASLHNVNVELKIRHSNSAGNKVLKLIGLSIWEVEWVAQIKIIMCGWKMKGG
jgi:hypothetical protein